MSNMSDDTNAYKVQLKDNSLVRKKLDELSTEELKDMLSKKKKDQEREDIIREIVDMDTNSLLVEG